MAVAVYYFVFCAFSGGAIAMTYLVELPAAKVIKKWYQKKREKKELENEKQ